MKEGEYECEKNVNVIVQKGNNDWLWSAFKTTASDNDSSSFLPSFFYTSICIFVSLLFFFFFLSIFKVYFSYLSLFVDLLLSLFMSAALP